MLPSFDRSRLIIKPLAERKHDLSVEQQLPLAELPPPLEETVVSSAVKRRLASEILPRSLGEALEELEQDDVLLHALGPYVSDRYLEAKKQEYRDYKRQVTQWELDRYLGRY